MGILDNFAKRVADQITKAAPEATPITQAQMTQAISQFGNSVGLPRNPLSGNVPFTPGIPIVPGAINRLREDGRPDPRRYEYQVAQNINVTETRLTPFKTLRAAADQIDIIRRCVEVLKNKAVGLDWDIVLSSDAAEKVMAETGERSYNRAMELAKAEFSPEINRLKQFWKVPDIQNGLIFSEWLSMALEDILVLDAWAVWPQKSVGGDLKGLQILDGATIKPLIDDRGMRPASPWPAFQQILYGFPRSEFSAPQEEVEADGEFTQDELAYLVRNRRTTTVYGYGPVERSLPLADIYLRRQQWIRAEYTDGVIPEMLLLANGVFTPDQLKAYENVLNDFLSGQTAQRKQATVIPEGLSPVFPEGYGEKFKDTLDDYLVTAICGHFGVQPSEIGMNSKSGLGGSGIQAGEAESSEVIGLLPLMNWVGHMISQLSYVFLGMPRELEFRFMPSERNDGEALAREADIKRRNGGITLNEQRSIEGLPLLDAPEADLPMVTTPQGTFFITEAGMVPLGATVTEEAGETEAPEASESAAVEESADFRSRAEALGALIRSGVEPASAAAAVGLPGLSFIDAMPVTLKPTEMLDAETEALGGTAPTPAEVEEEATKAIRKEVGQFIRWLRKSPTDPFEFVNVPAVYGETLNKFVAVADYDGARWYAERYLA